ncbi:hypothetical protein K1719_023424 [Acacia pycnantha]|nr:hypothetical protein K1719_023424 [Acacia pycnantha]
MQVEDGVRRGGAFSGHTQRVADRVLGRNPAYVRQRVNYIKLSACCCCEWHDWLKKLTFGVCILINGAEDPSIAGTVLDSPFSDLVDLMMELVDTYKARLPKFTIHSFPSSVACWKPVICKYRGFKLHTRSLMSSDNNAFALLKNLLVKCVEIGLPALEILIILSQDVEYERRDVGVYLKILNHVAVKIALKLKKVFIDNNLRDVKKLTMDKIHDIYELRLIVDNEEDYYRALRVIHHIWSEVPGKLNDYISHPKLHGYVISGMMVVHALY